MQKEMIFVIGVEGSGTRLITKIFMDCGYFGDATHNQRLDKEIPDKNKIVFRRSIPHGGVYPDIVKLRSEFVRKHYKIKTVITHRDFIPNCKSKVKSKHNKQENVFKDIQDQYIYISNYLFTLEPFIIISTSQLFLDKKRTLNNLFTWLNIEVDNLDKISTQIKNPDLKWS